MTAETDNLTIKQVVIHITVKHTNDFQDNMDIYDLCRLYDMEIFSNIFLLSSNNYDGNSKNGDIQTY